MKRSKKKVFLFVMFFAMVYITKAEITLAQFFYNNMVLQRNSEVFLYGWAGPNEEFDVYASSNEMTIKVKKDVEAKWRLEIDTPEVGGSYKLSFIGNENEIVLQNVLVDEIWLCSGNSNMEWNANSGIDNKAKEVANVNYPNIGLFTVKKRTAAYPQDDVSGAWEVCGSETMPNFSAVAYFFTRKVQKELGIPKRYTAKVKIKNNIVMVWSKKVKNPKGICFAWKSDAISNLYNEVGGCPLHLLNRNGVNKKEV